MRPEFEPATGAAGWAVSNPPVFSTAALRASLPLFENAGMAALRAKSVALTAWLERLVRQQAGAAITIITPPDPAQRGCQLSLRLRAAERGRALFEALGRGGIVCDWREPDVIRLAPAPLYNGFVDVLRAAVLLGDFLRS
jgi:kynureninase